MYRRTVNVLYAIRLWRTRKAGSLLRCILPLCLLATMTLEQTEVAVGATNDWSTYRFDITRSGITSETIGPALYPQWKFIPNHAPRPAWPMPAEERPRMHSDNAYHVVVADDNVYFGSSVTSKVYSIDTASGEIRWTFFAEGPVRFAPTVYEGHVYVGSDDGCVYCLDAENGKLIWKYRAGPSDEKVVGNGRIISLWPVRTSVLVDDGVVYFGAGVFPYEGIYICALNADDGSVIWRNDTIGDRAHELDYGGISPHGYLVASKDILYVPSGRAMPAAFDRRTGKFLFFCSAGGKYGGTWTLLDGQTLIAGVDTSAQAGRYAKIAYDARTGSRKGDVFGRSAGIDMVVTAEVAYILTVDGISAVRRSAQLKAAKKTSLKWRYRRKRLCALIMAGNILFAGGEGLVVGIDVQTGKELWKGNVSGRAVGLAAARGRLIVSTDKGPIHCFGKEQVPTPKEIKMAINPSPYRKDKYTALYESAAERIVKQTSIKKGYCLVLDGNIGRLAFELAKRTNLKFVGIEKDPAKVTLARQKLEAAGLWGCRVVVQSWDISSLPPYFANLIVSDGLLLSGRTDFRREQLQHVLRPYGGVAIAGMPSESSDDGGWTMEDGRRRPSSLVPRPSDIKWRKFVRGKLAGAGNWTQHYGNPQNTACSGDELVNGPLGILWYGEPGPLRMVERHGEAVSPVSINGRLFIQGGEIIMAVDAYNGTLLWERKIPGAVRVKTKTDCGNLAVTEDSLYVAAQEACYRLDVATGETIQMFKVPPSADGIPRRWGYVSVQGNILYGSTSPAMKEEYAAFLKVALTKPLTAENAKSAKNKFEIKNSADLAVSAVKMEWKEPEAIPPRYRQRYDYYKKLYPVPDENLAYAVQRAGTLFNRMTAFGKAGEFMQAGAVTKNLIASDKIFAIDTETAELLWVHKGDRIANITMVLGDGNRPQRQSMAAGNPKIFFAESTITDQQKTRALEDRRQLIRKGIYKEREGILEELRAKKKRRAELLKADKTFKTDRIDYEIRALETELFEEEFEQGRLSYDDADVRLVVALDAVTGEELWKKPLDLTGCGGDGMGAAYSDGMLLFFGNYGNHDAWRFKAGALKWRRITALSADNGDVIWSRALNYRTRPLIVGDKIIIEPRACDLRTGRIIMRRHPITGQEVPWEFLRPGHTCGVTSASAGGLFYRSSCTAFYDLAADRGVTIFGAYRPGCSISIIPASGLLLSAEASCGCTCSYPLRCSFALIRKPARPQPWTVFVTQGAMTPVKYFAINLGAVADMKDDEGTVWFAYPNPKTEYNKNHFPNYGVKFDLNDKVLPGMGYFCSDFKGITIEGSRKPWLFTSGCQGLLRCELPLIDNTAGQKPATYTVRLGFSAPPGDKKGQRVFDIKLAGRVVLGKFDILQTAGKSNKAVVKEFKGIRVENVLTLELVPKLAKPLPKQAPIINFIEVIKQEGSRKAGSS
ncbi:MAG: PQQ-binding-like beta-propeller repeat protein [Sedimentisphaerales bacterium]